MVAPVVRHVFYGVLIPYCDQEGRSDLLDNCQKSENTDYREKQPARNEQDANFCFVNKCQNRIPSRSN